MTKKELIYAVFDRLKISSDDTDLSKELVSFHIDAVRAQFIKNQYGNKSWDAPIEIRQEICLRLSNASSIDGVTCFGTILRTNEVIPKGISIRGLDTSLLKVRTYDRKAIAVNVVPIERLPYIGHNPYLVNMLYAAVDTDRRVYFLSNRKEHKMLEAVKVEGIFENPEEADKISCDSVDAGCEPWDREYPMESAMQVSVIDEVVKIMAKRESLPEDNTNDGEDARK